MNDKKMDVYDIVTERIVKILESGVIPWNSPYDHNTSLGYMPRNLVNDKEYRGVNRWLLYGRFENPYYVSANQCRALGGVVRKEEWWKNSLVTWWKTEEHIDERTQEVTKRWYLRFYKVWNVLQCDGIKHKRLDVKLNDNPEMVKPTAVVRGMPNKPAIKQDSPKVAYYNPKADEVHIGKVGNFKTSTAYYATLFHELVHSTGHESRLNRGLEGITTNKLGYSREELVAELGSAYLCELSGIGKPTLKNAAAYIQHWVTFITEDPKAMVGAALRAEKACDYILNREHESSSEEE
jgi:antirestriction protein ArdC